MNIYIAVPTFENIHPATFKSIYDLNKCRCNCIFDFVKGYDCAVARNVIVSNAMKMKDIDYILMVDSDVVLPENTLKYFLDDPKEVQLGLYLNKDTENLVKNNNYAVTMFKMGEQNFTQKFYDWEIKNYRSQKANKVQVHGGGFGCAFVDMKVFQKLAYPWFNFVSYGDGQLLSEDLYFCHMCQQANIPVYMDTRIQCGHITQYIKEI